MYSLLVDNMLIDQSQSTVSRLNDKIEIHEYQLLFNNIQTIKVSLLNKCNNDTQLDESGVIVDDLLIIINKIVVDHVDLTAHLNKISVYKDTSGQVHKTFNYITFNGDYQIKIHKNLLYTEWLSSYL